ncbi:pilus assembly protein CblD [Enterobacter cloacae]|uniref:CfaE/CblD family pilus tip adhesin n=1 Tax=Enterobacter cloacae TaxID=550 RepID=UPI0034A4967B
MFNFILIIMIMIFNVSVYAEQTVVPTDQNITIKRDFDLSQDTPDLSIWMQKINGLSPIDLENWTNTYGGEVYFCLSDENPEYGACKSRASRPGVAGTTIIRLQLTERRSGMRTIVELEGMSGMYFSDEDIQTKCTMTKPATNYNPSVFNLSSLPQINPKCQYLGRDGGWWTASGEGTYLTVKLSTGQQFPVGGVWEGTLILKQGSYYKSQGRVSDATWTAHLQFDVTDANHIDIYFPEFGTAAPLVPLNIHPTGGASPTPGGQDVTNLDMCLYDGFNVNSSKYEVLLEDGNHHTPAGRPMGWFSVYRDGGDENQPRDRIDYQVRMNNPETDAMMDVRNGELITWNAVNTHRVRPVRLPSISYPVLCAPTPLEFRVNKFATADKNAGQYHGTLRVTFTPTTTTL